MFEYVKDAGLKPARAYAVRKKTDLIILHHVEGDMSVSDIHVMHMKKGDRGIDYNIYVGTDGTVFWGRGLQAEGGHVKNGGKTRGMNARSVGIVCNGDFNREQMGAAQLSALKRVVADVVRHYGFESVSQIITHKEAAGAGYTDCPGKYFPAEKVRAYIRDGGEDTLQEVADSPADANGDPLYWHVAVNELNYRDVKSGKVLGQLHRGDIVYLDRYVMGEDWARVRIGGREGRLAKVWLKFIGK